METRSLLAITTLGLLTPVQQFEVRNAWNEVLGIADFVWPDLGVLHEPATPATAASCCSV